MPTPATTARQCLTPEAAKALDDAVAVARRRGHTQTTSVHMIFSLLSLPSSPLREACSRTRNNAYSSRAQFKALELCLGLSLDRLPSSSPNPNPDGEPPVSNSLMAAIKRSQANQRRQPENFNFYHTQNPQQPSCSTAVMVELQNMIVSILDDPVVSRVFGEAGFISYDIKIALLRPVNQFFRYSRYEGPPLVLCNLIPDSDMGRKGFTFPFLGNPVILDGEQNCKRIWEVLMKTKQKNPLLVGVPSYDALKNFLRIVHRREVAQSFQIPSKLSGLNIVCVENELSRYAIGDYDEEMLRLKIKEVKRAVEEQCRGPGGVIINYGDLKMLAVDEVSSNNALEFVVQELSNLINIHAEKLWVIGSVERYEVYLKVLNKFPSLEKDWDLQLLTITCPEPFTRNEPASYAKSSLMESFVPFGGLFATSSDFIRGPLLSSSYPSSPRCFLCNEKCREEISALSDGSFGSSVAGHYQHSSLPSWLQSTNRIDSIKATDDKMLFMSAKIDGLHRKWDSVCHRLHYNQHVSTMNPVQQSSQDPSNTGFQITNKGRYSIPPSKESSPLGVLSDCNDAILLSMFSETPSKSDDEPGRTTSSPSSISSVTMDLGLRITSGESWNQRIINESKSFDFDRKDFKTLFRTLTERVGRQEEAVKTVSQRIAQCRRDIWFHLTGPDNLGKKKLAVALSEVIYGTTQNLICVDLSFPEPATKSLFDHLDLNKYDLKIRGKTVVDYIAEKLSEKPMSIVFLENIEKSDHFLQKSLTQAVKTGKFSDSHGREVSISNTIFITASGNYSEEHGRELPVQIQVEVDLVDRPALPSPVPRKRVKRANMTSYEFPDLNLPAGDDETIIAESTEWMEGFLKQVDETVTFEPFSFD
ncbi:unnamed protein product [Cuscuta epithymum]|uniref:Clp R domain-containing protein n=1 Tax=Cuscuta epithymum TaxID=186058 RepID=A0AAV0EBV5_9ASTE|nr:unnamed protein product [Cuscuta epithymum]